jgi:heat-inducible transcriptional repressor
MGKGMKLTKRQALLLEGVVDLYIDKAAPVSSSQLAHYCGGRHLSPATIRSTLRGLADLGLLQQTHSSAGRIPTQKGLRAYLDAGINPRLHPWDKTHLNTAAEAPDLSRLSVQIGQCLAEISGQLAVVGVPCFTGSTFREMGLVMIAPGRLLAYFVSPGGHTQQKIVEIDVELASTELQRIQNFLSAYLIGRTLFEVRMLLEGELAIAQRKADHIKRLALEIGLRALPTPDTHLVIEGASHLAAQPEFSDYEKLGRILKTIESKEDILRILKEVGDTGDVIVLLSSEHDITGAQDLSCVGTSCGRHHQQSDSATISLMGPARMDYQRIIPMLKHAKKLFERRWKAIY